MRSRPALALCAGALAACATPAIVPGDRVEVRRHPVDAMGFHESCAKMRAGDRVEYRYSAPHPVAFNIHYHEGKVVISPVVRERALEGVGVFDPLTAQDYCLMWEAGPVDTLLDYSVRLVPGGARR
jgi:hypothetical protein